MLSKKSTWKLVREKKATIIFVLFSAKLSLPWAQNTFSIVEKENRNDYIVIQYVIDDKWELLITRNDNEDEDDYIWKVERQTPEGQTVLLKGKRQVFQAGAPNEKNPKRYD